MPEGDTIYRTAATLRPLMENRWIRQAESPDGSCGSERLEGRLVRSVEARGKHLLIHLESGMVIHSHMGMTGSWHVYRDADTWRKPRRLAALVLRFTDSGHQVVCFTPKQIELLTPAAFRRDPWLSRLGPDLLANVFDTPAAIARFRVHQSTPIGEAIMNQTIVCGIGNVYKSELLFLERIQPGRLVNQLSDDQLESLLSTSRRLMRKNLGGYPRQTRFRHDGAKKWVYGRAGQPCFKCGCAIQTTRQGDLGRTTYWCSACQS